MTLTRGVRLLRGRHGHHARRVRLSVRFGRQDAFSSRPAASLGGREMSEAPESGRFRWARRFFWLGFGLVALNFALSFLLNPFFLMSPAALIAAVVFSFVLGGLAAGVGALFDLGAQRRLARRTVALLVLIVYVSGYLGARAGRVLVHATTHSGGTVFHGVRLGDPGLFNTVPLLRAAVALVFLPAGMAESLAWEVADPMSDRE
jgi:hypothetical protein